ncbi:MULTISPECIES: hypothetical protein [unclassified Microcoleus]|uniref:hypothetical protein n=1 Tax=unclassified Microcoleus TaxID=2642155 RepID=UPI002FD6FD14
MATPPPKGSSDPQDYSKFERKIAEEVNKREAPTFIEGRPIPANYEERSYFDVYSLDFGRLDDEPPLTIAGNDAQIALQSSMLRALDQLLGARGLGPFNFSVWTKEFENGFPSFQGSAELKKMRAKEPWPGVSKENRPQIIVMKPDKAAVAWDFNVVQLLPDRKRKNEWQIFTGSWRDIAREILNWWNQKEGGGEASAGKPRLTSDISQLSKHPYISLYFREIPASGRGGTPLESEISFRLMDQIEYQGLLPDKSVISLADIKRYAKAIERVFNPVPDKPYAIARGRGSYTYNNWPLGYKLWLLANSASEAERVFKDVLKIQNHIFDEIYMGIGASRNPAKKYPITAPIKKVIDEDKALANQRQTGSITFRWAKLILPMTKETLVLVSRQSRTRVDERLQ